MASAGAGLLLSLACFLFFVLGSSFSPFVAEDSASVSPLTGFPLSLCLPFTSFAGFVAFAAGIAALPEAARELRRGGIASDTPWVGNTVVDRGSREK